MVSAVEAAGTLGRTPRVLAAWLEGLDEDWLRRDDGPGTWSAYDIVGHLLNADLDNWLPRARTILEHGTGRAFEPFDREAMLGWEQVPFPDLLRRFTGTRAASLAELATIEPGQEDRRGLHSDVGEVTLGQLLATWVAHDLTHLGQIGEVLARRYREAVGPWRVFMPALDRVAEAE